MRAVVRQQGCGDDRGDRHRRRGGDLRRRTFTPFTKKPGNQAFLVIDPRGLPTQGHRQPLGVGQMRATRCIAALALLVATAVAATGAPASGQTARNPILFVHGWNSSASTWNTMVGRFQAAGYTSNQLM